MSATIIDGKVIAEQIKKEVRIGAESLQRDHGITQLADPEDQNIFHVTLNTCGCGIGLAHQHPASQEQHIHLGPQEAIERFFRTTYHRLVFIERSI